MAKYVTNFPAGIQIKGPTAAPYLKIQADTNSSPAPKIEIMRGAHDTWGTGDNYNDWRIENVNHLKFYSGTSSVSSGAAVERFEVLSDGSGITNNNAYVIPGSAGTSGQVLKWPSSGTVLEWAADAGDVDTNINLANNPVWTITSTSGIGLYIVRDKDDSNSDNDMIRIRDDHADVDKTTLYVLSDGGAQMGTNASGRTPTLIAQASYGGATWPFHLTNGKNTNTDADWPAVGMKWKISGWGSQDESDKWSGILVSSQADYGVKHKMDFYLQADSSASGGVNSPVVAMTIKHDLEIDGNFNDTSDIALKSNIISIPNGLDMIEKLNPVTFNWDRQGNNKPSAGFIAQEVEEVLPDLVRGEEGEKTIKTAGIVGYLVKAVQELSARVKELEG